MPNRRFLFFMHGAVTAKPAARARLKQRTTADFHRMFPAWSNVDIPYFWSGLLNLARDRMPYVGLIGEWENANTGLSYHGNGVAMGRFAGAGLAEMAMGQAFKVELPDISRLPPRQFPFGMVRRGLLHLANQTYKFKDRG